MSSHWGFLESYGYNKAKGWTLPEPCAALPAVMPLPSLASWTLRGRGALEFLQGYVSSDLASIEEAGWQTTSFCTIKGRVLATAYVSGTASEVSFVMREEMISPLIDSLKRFIAFARSCAVVREPMNLFGCIGELGEDQKTEPLRLSFEVPLGLLLTAEDKSAKVWQRLAATGHSADERLWTDYEIRAGFLHICEDTREEFLPQMLGLDQLGAVSYSKGCYLGQEIVARAAHRGKVKRKLVRIEIESGEATAIRPGSRVRNQAGRDAGMLVALAPNSEFPGSHSGLAVIAGDEEAMVVEGIQARVEQVLRAQG